MVIAISMIIRVVKVPATIDTKYFARSDRSVASVLGNPIPVKRLQIVIALYLNMWIDLCIEWTAIFSYAHARSSRVIHVPNHASEPTVDRRSRWYKSDTLPTPSPPCALFALLPSTFHSQTLTLFKLFCPSYTHPYCIYQLLHCCTAAQPPPGGGCPASSQSRWTCARPCEFCQSWVCFFVSQTIHDCPDKCRSLWVCSTELRDSHLCRRAPSRRGW